MNQQYEQAVAYVATMTGDAESIVDFRVLHDQDKAALGQTRRSTLREAWPWLCSMNSEGWGIFMVVAQLDGAGQKMDNVQYLRACYLDLDGQDAQQQYELACGAYPSPTFAVCTSPSKYHVYWATAPFTDRERFTTVQRKLAALFHGDRKVIDATRVMRLAGTFHMKTDTPVLVTCHSLAGYGQRTTLEALETALAHITVIEGGEGTRKALGEGEQAPSLDWMHCALKLVDPNELDRDHWLSISSAVKQAGWTLATPDELERIWLDWCARYQHNNEPENQKLWKSIDSTEVDWKTLVKRVPSLGAALNFGNSPNNVQIPTDAAKPAMIPMPVAPPPTLDCSGEYLTHFECQEYFKGCTFVVKLGQILTPGARFMNSNQFNGAYGGKQFIITGEGKKTDEPWKAALRSTLWTVPKVDHIRFLPSLAHGAIVKDSLGRTGVNMYKPAVVKLVEGDPTPFLNHLAMLLPDPNDQALIIEWMAHNVKYPGHKIPWAPVIQSTEGAGKGVFKAIMTHALGIPYVHFPNAKELTHSGSTFNGWLRNKLFILADEIKVDDRRDLIEVLKPLISEVWIEIQSKGVDQELEDCYANWMFFTNYKDAIPLSKNGRRYALFFSYLQTKEQKPPKAYYDALYDWVHADGAAIVTNWLLQHPIQRGKISMEAPETSSTAEAIGIGRSPIERAIQEAIEDGMAGFKGGYVSSLAVIARCKALSVVKNAVTTQTVTTVMQGMGYVELGRSTRAWIQEDHTQRATLYGSQAGMNIEMYGRAQGYE